MRGILLLVLFASALAWPLYVTGSLSQAGAIITANRFSANLESDARVELTHNLPLQICFQAVYSLPQNPDTWNETCSDYLSFEADGSRIIHTGSVRLRNLPYLVGIYSKDGFQPQADIALKVGNVNDSCASDQVYDETEDACRNPDGFLDSDTPANNVNFPVGMFLKEFPKNLSENILARNVRTSP